MANNATVTLTFKVSEDGSLKLATGNINKAAKATDNLATSQQKLGKASDETNYKLNQGTIGSSSAARSFSKLNQAIGEGPNGLVGAYATLAANAFAVSAAFNTLRSAAQVEQMMKGLAAQGARTGKSLVNISTELQKITDYSISAAEAMEATALMSSTGLSSKAMKELTEVAYNASLALGRAVPDSLDRISKGVAKLEPELLDELGIMTKLSEAQSMYALQNNKTVQSLTSLEKRQAMANAVAAEGQAKFGGLAEEIGANPYDKLAANFSNLVKEVLSGINTLIEPLVGLFSGSKAVLLGGIILFASTIRQQLLPVLYLMGKVAKERRQEFVDMAEESRKAAKASLDAAKIEQQAAIVRARSSLTGAATDKGRKLAPKGYSLEKIQQGEISSGKELEAQLNSLNRSIESRGRNLKKYSGDRFNEKNKELDLIKEEKKRLQELYDIQINGDKKVSAAKRTSRQENLNYFANLRGARAEEKRSQAIELAGEGQFGAAWTKASQSVDEYKKKVKKESQASRILADGSIKSQGAFSALADKVKVAGFEIGTVGRVGAAAFMRLIPMIGTATLAVGMLWSAYEKWGRSNAVKAQIEALSKLQEVLDNTAKAAKELNRLSTASIPLGLKASQALTIQSNSTEELASAFDEVIKATGKAATNTSTDSFFKALFGSQEDATKYVTGITSGPFLAQAQKELENSTAAFIGRSLFGQELGTKLGILFADILPQEFNGIDEVALASSKAMSQLSLVMDKEVYESMIKSKGGLEQVSGSLELQSQFIKEAAQAYAGLSDSVKQLQEAFKSAGESTKAYYQSIIPKTSFDDLVSSFQSINKELFNLDKVVGGRSAIKQLSLLSAMPDEIKMTLTFDQSDTLTKVQQLNNEISIYNDKIVKIRAEEGLSTQQKQKQIEVEEKKIEKIESQIQLEAAKLPSIKQELINRQNILQQYQEQEISIKSQQSLQAAIMKAEQELYDKSAAGVARKIDMQNKSIRLEQAQLKVQEAMIELDLDRQRALVEQLNVKLQLLGVEADLNSQAALGNKITAERIKAEAGAAAKITPSERGKIDEQIALAKEETLSSLKSQTASTADDEYFNASRNLRLAEVILDKTIQREDVNRAIRIGENAVNALRTQNAALEKGITSEKTKQVMLDQFNADKAKEIADKRQEILELTLKNNETEKNIFKTLTNQKSVIEDTIIDITKQAAVEKRKLENEKIAMKEKARLEVEYIRSLNEEKSITEGAVANIEEAARLDAQILDQKIKQVDLAAQLNMFQTILGGGLEDSLSKLQETIALEIKRRDIVADIAEKQTKISQLRSEISIIRAGGQVNEKTQKQFAVESAQIAYENALRTQKLREASINAEYDLLDAQNKVNVANFKMQSLLVKSLWEVFNQGKEMPADLAATLANLDQSAEALNRLDTKAMRESAIISSRKDVELAGLAYEKARAERDSVTGLSRIANDILNRQATRESERRTGSREPTLLSVNNKPLYSEEDTNAAAKTVAVVIAAKQAEAIEKVSNITIDTLTDSAEKAAKKVSIIPEGSRITSGFGMRKHPITGKQTLHPGVDIAMNQGTPIAAPISGRLSFNEHPTGGRQAFIKSEDGKMVVGMGHLSKQFEHLSGKIVKAGDIIAKSGGTPGTPGAGKSTAAHLHLSLTVNGEKVDPTEPLKLAMETSITPSAENKVPSQIVPTKEQGEEAKGIVQQAQGIDVVAQPKPLTNIVDTRTASQQFISGFYEILDRARADFEEFSAAAQERLGQDFGPQGRVLSSLNTLMTSLPSKFKEISLSFSQFSKGLDIWKQGCFDVKQAQSEVAESSKKLGETAAQETDKATASTDKLSTAQQKSKEGFSMMAEGAAAAFSAISSIIGMIASVLKASSDAKIAGIDKEIAAEQKRDGKSAASLSKIEAMEQKKDAMAKKSFNIQKKLMMAQAVMSAAAGVAMALASAPAPFNFILAGITAAMGAAQIAIISGMQYESSYAPKAVSMPSTVSIGKRDNSVNLASGPNANAGAEVGYLRGAQGTGTNAGNYRTIGSAYGGELMRGYGNRGFVVGEKGPEVITPDTPISVTPANESSQAQSINASFNIQALDASGVQDILVSQKGNIIKMLREASNASGKSFMEDVNVDVYTRPSVGKL